MARKGSLTLADYPLEDVRVRCERCGREAVYRKAELCKRAGLDAVLPRLRLQIANRVGCEITKQNLNGPAPGMEQCQMGFPDLVKLYQRETAAERRADDLGVATVRQSRPQDR